MIKFEMLISRRTQEALGLLPAFLSEGSPDCARDQIHRNYQHGGGWRRIYDFVLNEDNSLSYADDPPYKPIAQAKLRDELIVVYRYSFVAIIQADRSFEVARVD